jgi:hypothetical protein
LNGTNPGPESIMRASLVVSVAAAAALFAPGPSQARQGPWCAGYSIGFSTWREDCSIPTLEMCRLETIAGNRGYCWPNPYWRGHVIEGAPETQQAQALLLIDQPLPSVTAARVFARAADNDDRRWNGQALFKLAKPHDAKPASAGSSNKAHST